MRDWWTVVTAAAADADERNDGLPTWRAEYADVFADADCLARGLAIYRCLHKARTLTDDRTHSPPT